MSQTILIIEDDTDASASLCELLQIHGYEPTAASSINEAQSAVEKNAYNAILLDLLLPDGNALDWLPTLRGECPHSAIIIMTGSGDLRTAVKAMQDGADDYLSKPLNYDSLKLRLERTMELSQYRGRSHKKKLLRSTNKIYIPKTQENRTPWEMGRSAAVNDAPVLIEGETGTGKGVIARWIHDHSQRSDNPFVELNCSSLGGDLLQSELFGHRKGAFTSAIEDREGLIEVADGGTLFLDEIGDMHLSVQAKFLKVIEEKVFRRVGETRKRRSEFRLICATNRNLQADADVGRFRKDLYFRICVLPIRMLPLRMMKSEIPRLSKHILSILGKGHLEISPEAMSLLKHYEWPGNLRELSNVLERASILCTEGKITPKSLPGLEDNNLLAQSTAAHPSPASWNLEAQEERHLRRALAELDCTAKDIASALGVSRATLYRKLKKYGIDPPHQGS